MEKVYTAMNRLLTAVPVKAYNEKRRAREKDSINVWNI